MKAWFLTVLCLLGPGWSVMADPVVEPVTLVNALPVQPVFNYSVGGVVQTRALGPGERVLLPPGLFSGLGLKKIPLAPGEVFYMARFGAFPGLYRLGPAQILLLNTSGEVLDVTLGREVPAEGTVGSGNLALGAEESGGGLDVSWNNGTGKTQTIEAQGGKVYRWTLENPPGETGSQVILTPWE